MTKTYNEVIERAHRRIRVLASDEPLSAEMRATGIELLEALSDEVALHTSVYWYDDYVPKEVFLPLSYLLAVELAPEYNRAAPESRPRALMRLMEVTRRDDRNENINKSATYM